MTPAETRQQPEPAGAPTAVAPPIRDPGDWDQPLSAPPEWHHEMDGDLP